MIERLLQLICLLWNVGIEAQSPDYAGYHERIIVAETQFFLYGNADSALHNYQVAFTDYDYVFPRDVFNALQIAVFSGAPYEDLLATAFQAGVQPDHFMGIPVLQPLVQRLGADTSRQANYRAARSRYRRSIDYGKALQLYRLAIADQLQKSGPPHVYTQSKRDIITRLRTGELSGSTRVVGIDDPTLFAEIGKAKYDLDSLKWDYSTRLDYFRPKPQALTATYLIVMLLHNSCAFVELEETLRNWIAKGLIHPREVALLYDNRWRQVNERTYPCALPPAGSVFLLNKFCNYRALEVDRAEVNRLRERWQIAPLAVDAQKRRYESAHGFDLTHGFWDSL